MHVRFKGAAEAAANLAKALYATQAYTYTNHLDQLALKAPMVTLISESPLRSAQIDGFINTAVSDPEVHLVLKKPQQYKTAIGSQGKDGSTISFIDLIKVGLTTQPHFPKAPAVIAEFMKRLKAATTLPTGAFETFLNQHIPQDTK